MIRKLGMARIAAAAAVAAAASSAFGGVALAADNGWGGHGTGEKTPAANTDVNRAGNGGSGGHADPDCGNQLVQVIDSSRTDLSLCNGAGGAGGNGHSSVY